MQHCISKAVVATMSKTPLSKTGPTQVEIKLPQGVQKPVRTSTAFETRLYDVCCTFPLLTANEQQSSRIAMC